jgi:hypothetical protein
MSKQAFTFFDNVTINNTQVTGNGTFLLASSTPFNNGSSTTGFKSLKLVVEYGEISPPFGNDPQTFDVDVVVEGLFGTRWTPLAYQFTPYRNPNNGNTRIIQMQPSLSGFDAGVDDVVFVGDATLARISRQQGVLPDSQFRMCLLVTERGYVESTPGSGVWVPGPGSFQSVKISAFGEAFDA